MFAKTMKMWDERVATATEYGLYRVRQISGKDYRAIERIKHADGKPFLGTRREMEIALIDYAHGNNLGGRLDRSDSEGVHRWVVRERPEKLSKRAQALAMQKDGRDRFDPRLFEAAGTEDGIPSEAYVVAIEGALDKSRGSFEKHWVAALGNSGGQTQSGFDLLADDGELIDEPKPTPISARELSPDEGVFSEEPVDFRNHTALALFDL